MEGKQKNKGGKNRLVLKNSCRKLVGPFPLALPHKRSVRGTS